LAGLAASFKELVTDSPEEKSQKSKTEK
jgi:hypothetical protein